MIQVKKIKLNSKHVKKTNTDYYGLFPSLSIRSANKVFRQMKNNKGVELSLSKKEVENLVLKALSDVDIKQYVKKFKMPNFRNVFLNLNELPKKIKKNECDIVNLFFHWICYFKNNNQIYYFDSVVRNAPIALKNYFKENRLIENTKKVQKKGDPAICGYLCIIVLYLLGVKK